MTEIGRKLTVLSGLEAKLDEKRRVRLVLYFITNQRNNTFWHTFAYCPITFDLGILVFVDTACMNRIISMEGNMAF